MTLDKGQRTALKRQRVVIVGAGFGGLWAARAFSGSPVEVLLISRNNYHTFLPLLHQVAAAELEPEEIVYPVRKWLRKLPNVRFAMAQVKQIDLESKFVETDNCLIPYDFLILATGSAPKFFGVAGAAEYAFALKTLEQAIALRNHIIDCFEQAAQSPNESRRRSLLTFTIVGGGATGVELAGALAELIYENLVKDYSRLDLGKVRLVLLQAGDSLLPDLPKHLRTYAKAQLRKKGVEVYLQARVSEVTKEAVHLQDGIIATETVVWTAGVRGNSLLGELPTNSDRVTVLPTLQVPGHPQVYAIGDLASVKQDGVTLPMLAPVAIAQAKSVVHNIMRQIEGQNPLPWRYQHKGTMVIIGRHTAVLHAGKLTLTGFPAWILWLVIHLVNLLGFRNRLVVLINWVWGYLWRDRPFRIILPLNSAATSKSNKSNSAQSLTHNS